mmetsp:Transcript_25185/g.25395  ORF Transcript_25185/g.25395 Transcript_25185/m.25395 type:complete len:327 (+) Transcript_25185:192-1172(+)|eukprot:CAMPEP_0182428724 /NCGR_PEP_ID=MMETSP1167-20130531/23234_1 /TAXON_ID=2988 /ORGANISM="Mallomonas Sp, Strain CCMP3275" /LENGTH=326 /DNA_ID=CAMNT_0024611771 /DNA_START=162 /DNA_END=1142 /DNA_ORIENTATION=-
MRWSPEETAILAQIRSRLGAKLAARPQFPEVVGDRKLLRFVRGHNHDVDKACEMINASLDWRTKEHVDDIRKDIIENNLDQPSKFPFGELILKLIPQVVIHPEITDVHGNPLSVESLVPASIWAHISVENYLKFRIYCLEYCSIILEQVSEKMEKKALAVMGKDSDKPYGCIAQLAIIRCMRGMALSSFTNENKEIGSKVITLSSDNYPEVMAKCYIVNAPWIFGPVYAFAKLFMAPKTIAKISLLGHDFLGKLSSDLPKSHVPDFLGGDLSEYNQPTPYDLTEGGPLWCDDTKKSDVAAAGEVPTTVFTSVTSAAASTDDGNKTT